MTQKSDFAKIVSLEEFLKATEHYADDDVFRWFQASVPSPTGMGAAATDTLCLTFGEVRKALKTRAETFDTSLPCPSCESPGTTALVKETRVINAEFYRCYACRTEWTVSE